MDTCKFGVLLALFTGVRIGELCALQWGKISLKEQTIRIDATLQRLRDTSAVGSARTRIVISTPKSDTSVRTIPVTDYTAELCGKMAPHSSAAYVLTGTDSFMEPRALQYRMEKYTRKCGLEGVHFHTLRHPYVKPKTKKYESFYVPSGSEKLPVQLNNLSFKACLLSYSSRYEKVLCNIFYLNPVFRKDIHFLNQ